MDAVGTVADGLRHGARLLREDAGLAAEQAREILAVSPGNADAYRLLGAALRRAGDDEAVCGDPDGLTAIGPKIYTFVATPRTIGVRVGRRF